MNTRFSGNKPDCVYHTIECGNFYQYHREDGPAIEYADGDRYWIKNGLLHREDGPAIESSRGNSYYLHSKVLSQKQFDKCKIFMKAWNLALCPGMIVVTKFSEFEVEILDIEISGIRVINIKTNQEDFLHPSLHLKESEIAKYKCGGSQSQSNSP